MPWGYLYPFPVSHMIFSRSFMVTAVVDPVRRIDDNPGFGFGVDNHSAGHHTACKNHAGNDR